MTTEQAKEQAAILVQAIQDMIVNHEPLRNAAHKYALETCSMTEDMINPDHRDYNESLESLYYTVLNEYQSTIVIRALGNMNHSY